MIIRSNTLVLDGDEVSLPLIGYHNLVTISNIRATNEELLFPATNLANVTTHLPWKSSDNTVDIYLTTILDGSTDVDYVAIVGHNFGSMGSTVSIEATVDPNSPYDSPGFSEVVQATLIEDDNPLLFQFSDVLLAGAIRVRIQHAAPGDVYSQAAVMYVGGLLTLPRSISIDSGHIPINLGKKTQTVNGMSESGQFLGRIIRTQYAESKAEFKWFEPDWYRTHFDPFVLTTKDTPFFFAWNPDEQPTDVGYSWLIEDAIPEVDPVTRRMAVELNMRALA